MRDLYYIENVDISDNSVTLILSMNFCLSEFNDTDEFPITEIKLINPKIDLTIDRIQESIDSYNDGFFFEISDDKKILNTCDMGVCKNEIHCDQILVIHRKYNYNELDILIKQYKEYQNASLSTINELNTKVDSLKSLINKEIDSIENKLKTIAILPFENKKKQWRIELNVYKRMIDKMK